MHIYLHELTVKKFHRLFIRCFLRKPNGAPRFLLWCLLAAIPAQASDIKLFAAASLTDALTEIARLYQQQHPTVQIKTSFAGSSTLARQIEKGAPADIFISADKDWIDYLETRGQLNSASLKILLTNSLVLIAPKQRPVKLTLAASTQFASSFRGKLCTGNTDSVPAGKYAKQSLNYFGWWQDVAPRIVGTEDVRTALAFVERGECALGIVYQTDALMSGNIVQVASFPAESHKLIIYPGALTADSVPAATDFWTFLQSDQAKAIFIRFGFTTP